MSKQGMHHDKLVQTYNALSADVVVEGDDLKRIQEVLLGSKEYSRALSNEIKDYIETIEGKFSTKDLYQVRQHTH
jgi:hypothetical protein